MILVSAIRNILISTARNDKGKMGWAYTNPIIIFVVMVVKARELIQDLKRTLSEFVKERNKLSKKYALSRIKEDCFTVLDLEQYMHKYRFQKCRAYTCLKIRWSYLHHLESNFDSCL